MELTIMVEDEALVRALQEEARRRSLTVERLIPVLISSLIETGMAFAEPFHRMRQEMEELTF